jgi:DNA repair protein RadC
MEPPTTKSFTQQNLFPAPPDPPPTSISVYRVSLVKDRAVSYERASVSNSQQSQALMRNLILTKGPPDREQFALALLNVRSEIIGLNIVSVRGLSSAPVHPREVLRPAILANSAAFILCHNHPFNDIEPSAKDIAMTRKIVGASAIMGIKVHEHMIISMDEDRHCRFADDGIIWQMYSEMDKS